MKNKKENFDVITKNIRSLFLEISKEDVLKSTSIGQVYLFLDEIKKNIAVQKEILGHMESIRLLKHNREQKKEEGSSVQKKKRATLPTKGQDRKKVSTDDEWIDDGTLNPKKSKVRETFMDDLPTVKQKKVKEIQQVMFN